MRHHLLHIFCSVCLPHACRQCLAVPRKRCTFVIVKMDMNNIWSKEYNPYVLSICRL